MATAPFDPTPEQEAQVNSWVEHERDYDKAMAAGVAHIKEHGAEWGIKGYRAHNTSDGVAYVYTLTRSGRAVAWVEDPDKAAGRA